MDPTTSHPIDPTQIFIYDVIEGYDKATAYTTWSQRLSLSILTVIFSILLFVPHAYPCLSYFLRYPLSLGRAPLHVPWILRPYTSSETAPIVKLFHERRTLRVRIFWCAVILLLPALELCCHISLGWAEAILLLTRVAIRFYLVWVVVSVGFFGLVCLWVRFAVRMAVQMVDEMARGFWEHWRRIFSHHRGVVLLVVFTILYAWFVYWRIEIMSDVGFVLSERLLRGIAEVVYRTGDVLRDVAWQFDTFA
ncbi:hypothetical protein B0T17DRAFT_613717 [Bombardia bombarda]|uniref:Uncharacterized protein n=1 Tax=Bombardia bombarda TaxID=252184 RepID=A0AA39XN40_9PEZI|nr:hypothetical protein B0T17DRAFT_613717 [Bombardia bombarda]